MGNEEVMRISRKRGYLYPSFEIYSGQAGIYDYRHICAVIKIPLKFTNISINS